MKREQREPDREAVQSKTDQSSGAVLSTTPSSSDPCAYRIKEVSFGYWHHNPGPLNHTTAWAIHGLTFEVRAGEVLGVIGPNGSGKSSLLKLMARVLRPQQGRIELFGKDLGNLRQDAIARSVAYVPQESHLAFHFSIAEVVLMGRFPHRRSHWNLGGFGWETREDIQLAQEAMREMDIAHVAHRSISDVSGGERQRAIIARALTQQAQVLLLDEPTAFLDLNHQLEICRILRQLNERYGLTVVLVSHDLNLASQYSDSLLLLKEGRPYVMGSPREVIRREVIESVYGCAVLVDQHPTSGLPRVTLPGRHSSEASGRKCTE